MVVHTFLYKVTINNKRSYRPFKKGSGVLNYFGAR